MRSEEYRRVRMRFIFRPVTGLVISSREARRILNIYNKGVRGEIHVNVNLSLSRVPIDINADDITFPGGYKVTLDDLKLMTRDERGIYLINNKGIFKLEIRTERYYYKLALFPGCRSPTLEISGIHMHRVSGIDPWDDAKMKILLVGIRRCHRVLDICTGLGYTAINARIAGACYVLTIEKDENVLKIAQANPWSRRLADPQVEIILDDAVDFIRSIEDNSFDVIIHDPPRLSKESGGLYGKEFYRELYRVLKAHGKLYHYTGEPKKHRGINIVRSIAKRLHEVGFTVKPVRKALGVIATK
ncbi:MAG: SAM-dependent methyltransferase [Thermoprotei archaeon]|nr:MAG: SAM-dependent methyltransferase [Thermoprotei archaeon]